MTVTFASKMREIMDREGVDTATLGERLLQEGYFVYDQVVVHAYIAGDTRCSNPEFVRAVVDVLGLTDDDGLALVEALLFEPPPPRTCHDYQ